MTELRERVMAMAHAGTVPCPACNATGYVEQLTGYSTSGGWSWERSLCLICNGKKRVADFSVPRLTNPAK